MQVLFKTMKDSKKRKNRTDLNGNTKRKSVRKKSVNGAKKEKDKVTFYQCNFCSKDFSVKSSREAHVKKCKAKGCILSAEAKPANIPERKITIHQNIRLDKTPPIKLTIRRSPGGPAPDHFTVTNSLVLKEQNEDDVQKFVFPKIFVAMSEIKKMYNHEDRSQCPICHKPLKNVYRSAFIKHLHIHTTEMKFSCRVCGRKFRRSDHMQSHRKRHVTEGRRKK